MCIVQSAKKAEFVTLIMLLYSCILEMKELPELDFLREDVLSFQNPVFLRPTFHIPFLQFLTSNSAHSAYFSNLNSFPNGSVIDSS